MLNLVKTTTLSVNVVNVKNKDSMGKEKKLEITKDQLETIEHYQRMFNHNADRVQELCNEEKDDVVYGFELGKMHSRLRECFMGMMNLTNDIRANNQ